MSPYEKYMVLKERLEYLQRRADDIVDGMNSWFGSHDGDHEELERIRDEIEAIGVRISPLWKKLLEEAMK